MPKRQKPARGGTSQWRTVTLPDGSTIRAKIVKKARTGTTAAAGQPAQGRED